MLVTGNPAPEASKGSKGNMGFLRTPSHQKVPSSESISDRIYTIIESCQKRIKLLQSPFSTLIPWKRRRDRDCLAQDQEDKPYLEETVLQTNGLDVDLPQLVELPPGLGYKEWLASHTIDFFHHVNLLYGTICEFCTLSCCPDMSAPCMRQYLWFDEKGKKTRVAAPQYVDYVMTFTQNTVNDEAIFPTKFDCEFPSSFESIVKKIHRLLFHVIAHLYHSHFREVKKLGLHTHLNCMFAHFILFSDKFKLIEEKETEILKDLILALKIFPDLTPEQSDSEEKGCPDVEMPNVQSESPNVQSESDNLQSQITVVADVSSSSVSFPILVSNDNPSREATVMDTQP